MTTLITSKTEKYITYLIISMRIVLGALFLAAGIAKFLYPDSLLNTLVAFSFLPHGLLNIINMALPAAEIVLGFLLITGLFRKPAAIAGAFFALVFTGMNAYSYLLGYNADCGCFGKMSLLPWQSLVLDVFMLVAALAQLLPKRIHKDRANLKFRQLKRWLVPVASIVMLVALVCSGTLISATPGMVSADDSEPADPIHPMMVFTPEQLAEMEEAYQNAPTTPAAPPLLTAPFGASKSLLSHLKYTPSQRDQGQAGTCWVWTGTGVTEIAMDVQNSVYDRLSIQYFDSNYNGGSGSHWAGCGGHLEWFANFYNGAESSHMAIPWSNTNASYQDGSRSGCPDTAAVDKSLITTTPNYPITSMTVQTIQTTGVSQAQAIANIKAVLESNKAVWFSWYSPTYWDAWVFDFCSFWNTQTEATVWVPGTAYTSQCGGGSISGGHAVLCYGYDDATNCWLMLNSWGTTAKRSNGTFKVTQNLNYTCTYAGYTAFKFQTLNIVFPATTHTITVTSPNGAESWDAGSTQAITWDSVGVTGNVKIEVSRDSGTSWSSVIASTPNDGTHSWTVTGPGTATARIRITSITYPTANDMSDADFTINQSITVTAPNGAESWNAGTTQTITWTSVCVTGNVKIEISRDGGTTWSAIFASTANDGTENWGVTGPGTATARIRVSSVTTPATNDISDDDFTIVQSITITAPNGAESWNAGTTQTITWTSVGVTGNVKIEISRNGGTTWSTIIASTPDDGTHDWAVTGPATTTARIRVSSVTTPATNDISDDDFTITQILALIIPNGGESWNVGSTQTIKWASGGVAGNVKIEISRDGGTTWAVIIASTANDGTHNWMVTGPGTATARIKITSVSTPGANDISDADFTIVQSITVTAPNGAESWTAGTLQTITWTSIGITGYVKIEVSRDGGTTWSTIFASTANDGTEKWTVTGPATVNARIKITSVSVPSVNDTSDDDFTIVQSITVTSPNGAESWNAGTTQAITWTSVGVTGNVKIEISRDGGTTWASAIASTPNDGTENWVVIGPGTTTARIRVSSVTTPGTNDISDDDFTIIQSITVTSPNGAESWNAGTTQAITWTSVGVTGNVKIEISRDGGTTWASAIASTPNDGTQNWIVTGPGTTTARIRVSSVTTPGTNDISDDDFTIIQSITVTSPNGAESWNAGTTQAITWTSVGVTGNVKIEVSRNGGTTWTVVIASTPNDGTHNWVVTGPGTATARIRVSSVTTPGTNDISDDDFTIIQSITVTAPNGTESWTIGSTQAITWTSIGIGPTTNVKIEISRDGGFTWTTIVASTANDGTHNWKVTGPASTTVKIRITSLSFPTVSDTSDANFTIQ